VLEKQMHGADHEQNRRAGTENVLEIVGLGKAADLITQHLEAYQLQFAQKRDLLYSLLKEAFPAVKRNGHPDLCLPNTLSMSFPHTEANVLISKLKNLAVSAGAACHSEGVEVSAVLKAMAIPLEYAMGTIRFSTGRSTSDEDIRNAVSEIVKSL
jgi:cysteine sulfinate desulfinase/cysteine desulfurase-like protein